MTGIVLDSVRPSRQASILTKEQDVKQLRGRLMSVLVGVLFCLGVSPAAQAASSYVSYREGRLSVTAEDAPLREVLRQVARATGVEIEGLEALGEPVTVSLTSVPLREGLRRLLARSSYALVEEAAGWQSTRLARVLILAAEATAPIGSAPAVVRQAPPGVEVPADPRTAGAEPIEENASPYGMAAFSDDEEAKTPAEEDGAAH